MEVYIFYNVGFVCVCVYVYIYIYLFIYYVNAAHCSNVVCMFLEGWKSAAGKGSMVGW